MTCASDVDWLTLANRATTYFFKRVYTLLPEDREDARSAALIEGWKAALRWNGEGAAEAYIWAAMQRGIIDWLRLERGRQGQKASFRATLSLNMPTSPGAMQEFGDLLVDEDDPFEAVCNKVEIESLLVSSGLTEVEDSWARHFLTGLPQSDLARSRGHTDAAISQAKTRALKKLRICAGVA